MIYFKALIIIAGIVLLCSTAYLIYSAYKEKKDVIASIKERGFKIVGEKSEKEKTGEENVGKN